MRRSTIPRALAVLLFAVPTLLPAQSTAPPTSGRVVGRIVDAATGTGIAEVVVQVTGTTLGTRSGLDGRFALAAVPTGTVTLAARRIGYGSKTVTGVVVASGGTTEQNISLSAGVVQLSTQVVTASAERGTVSEALDAQRVAVGVVSAVTAEQIARSPDGDAAQAVKRVSGVTVQDGKYIFVRGLGERYTTSSLNGARVPSPEPEKRVVPLDMFPAGLLQTITTSKTFTPDQSGDFSGASVDIRTKEFPASRSASLQIGSGYASGATGAQIFSATSAGGESFASVNSQRDLPSLLRRLGNLQSVNLTQGDVNLLVGSFRNSWTPSQGHGAPLLNGAASFGGNDPVLFGHPLGYLFSGSISSGTDVKNDQIRGLALPSTTRGETVQGDSLLGQTVSQGVLWGGLANLSTMLGAGSRVSFNGLFNRSADNDARIERGMWASDASHVQITRMQYTQRQVFSGQLAGEHQVGEAHRFDWAATVSGVRRYEPDRSAFVQIIDQDTPGGPEVLRWIYGGTGAAVRTFSDLHENSHEYTGSYLLSVGPAGAQTRVKLGGQYRTTGRDAESFSYAISANPDAVTNQLRELPPELLFDGRYTTPSSAVFNILPLSQGGSYVARDKLAAGFLMAEVPIGGSLRLIGGARYERDRVELDAASTLGSPVFVRKQWNDVLPSLALNWKLGEQQQLRLSGSRTLARPEYRELAPITSRDVVNGENTQGNENLSRTKVTNADIRWELYPSDGEVVSVALFAKRFDLPIERVAGATSGGTSYVFYENARSADNYGVELELRKGLGALTAALEPLTFFSNATVMKSQIHLFDTTTASATNLTRRMVGQAPYVLNTGLTYVSGSGASSATMLFNRVGERIYAAGTSPMPDVLERPRNVLDFSLRQSVRAGATVRLDLKNLLDTPYDVRQGTITREYYRIGRTVQVGLQWRP
jgi:outer membrane receptor protein involved in Fe transport